ncbi:leukocyte immunoglobulin-like receptor subfamily B member 2 isoform X2 [Gasterosteus aculeatus]
MRTIQRLLLLAEILLLARCQQKPQVQMSPLLEKIFLGDLILLRCGVSTDSEVTWYVNDTVQAQRNHTLKIEAAAPEHSGRYQCQHGNGPKSDDYPINVLGYAPKATLIIRTGQPVVRNGGSVVLQLDYDDGVKGWKCWVNTGEQTKTVRLRRSDEKAVSMSFQPNRLEVPESVFWCTNQTLRSNQIRVRTSEKDVWLEMYPLPAVVGVSLTLKCLAWGTDRVTRAVFYKDNSIIQETQQTTYQINNVTESTGGRYKCEATYTHVQRTSGPPYQVVSDDQDVFVQVSPMRAVLDVFGASSMSCSCRLCPADSTYRWYKTDNGEARPLIGSKQRVMTPEERGTYACRFVWTEGRSLLSNVHSYQPKGIPITVIIVIVVVPLLVCVCAGLVVVYIFYKKRNTTEQLYQDVPMRSRDTADGGYDELQKSSQKESEHDALKKQDVGEGIYHTLGMEGAAGGE